LSTIELIPKIFDEALEVMDALVPQRMRWGSGEETFVRPVQWIVALLGTKVVPIRRFGLQSGNKTFGHRFHAPKAIVLKSPAAYEKQLTAAKVWADFDTRKAEIRRLVEAEAARLGGCARITEQLLDEVTALVEWPVVISGRMEQRFMALPSEVIIATIEHNQRYFPVFAGPVFGVENRLLPHFITISNVESRDATQIVVGNERVVRPRLSDALFFWDQDRKKPLSDHLAALGKVTFQKKLGTVADKSSRIKTIASKIAELVPADIDAVERAATLCKADLVTRMVYEFPELQGIMGSYYAKSSGETEEVASAIGDHYRPTQSGGPIPASMAGRVLALADKLDTLAGIFATGQKPTASKDPFALRRAALGVLRILIEAELDLDLGELLGSVTQLQPGVKNAALLVNELLQFHWDRLRSHYTDAGVAVEVFEAVMTTGATRPLDIHRRIRAVEAFMRLPEARKLAAAHKRVRNILRGAEGQVAPACDPTKFADAPEQALHQETLRLKAEVTALSLRRDYAVAMTRLADIQPAVDRFFDTTMVMAEDRELRANRLALLSELDVLCRTVADISCLPG
ncbi:MAG: glycine--tRNA ligase subunit beta, partial [Nevskiales bacterium]